MTETSRRVTVGCLTGVVLFLSGLALIPNSLTRHSYRFENQGDTAAPTFPIDKRLGIIRRPSWVTEPGETISLAALLKQQPQGLLVNFWATWCPPCVEELPSLELLSRAGADRADARLPKTVAISVDEHATDVTNFLKTLDYHAGFLILHDPDGELSRAVGTTKFPETYLLGPSGTVRYQWVGPQDWMAQSVIRILKTPL